MEKYVLLIPLERDSPSLSAFSSTSVPDPSRAAQGSRNSTATIAAVVVSVLIIAILLVAVIALVIVLVIFRKRTKNPAGTAVLYNNDGSDSLKEIDNPTYSSGKHQICACFLKSTRGIKITVL